jgi:hypothetical protein
VSESVSDMLEERKKRLNYVGWLGHGNLGDESLWKVIQDTFSPYQLVPWPVETGRQDHSLVSPVTVIGGSTGIPEWFENLRPTKFNYVFGAGVKDPAFYGYDCIFRERMKVAVMMDKLRTFRYIGVRGNISKALLAKQGIDSEVIGDPCLYLRPQDPGKKEEEKIGINLGSDGILWGMNEERIFDEIAKVCRNLKKEGYEPVLIPFWKKNVVRLRRLAVEEDIDFFDDWPDIQSTLSLIAKCKIFIGTKLHSLAFSAAADTPFIGLEYQPKCYDFAQSVAFERYTLRTDGVTEGKVMKLFTDLLENYEQMKKELAARVDTYRIKQRQFAARIVQDIESLPENCWQISHAQTRIRNEAFWRADRMFHGKTRLWYAWNRLFFRHFMLYMT